MLGETSVKHLYCPRQAQDTVLRQVVKEHLPEFLETVEAGNHNMPAFVKGELDAFLACGLLENGFTHLECPCCGFDRFLPFSCKTRTLCPSCAGRRMNETTTFLVGHVIPAVPTRHWALTFPAPLRYLLAYDSELCTKVINIFVHTVFGWQRRVAKTELGLESVNLAVPAAITAIHRVGSAINLNLHLHSVFLDGVFELSEPGARPEFRALPAPERGDVVALAWEVCERTTRFLQKLGRYFDAEASEADRLAQEHPLLATCCAASLQGSVVMGPRAGQRVLRLGDAMEHGENDHIEQVRTLGHGFNLYAGMRVSADDKQGRARMLRYILRPPIATSRLTLGKDGRVTYWLKEKWADGSTCFTFEPLDFIAKLLPLIPPPRANLVRYHGAFAPHAEIRAQIVPQAALDRDGSGQLALPFGRRSPTAASTASGAVVPPSDDGDAKKSKRSRLDKIPWAELAARTFEVDVLKCARCGFSPIRIVAVVTSPTREQLEAAGGDGAVSFPELRSQRSRAPPTGQLPFEFVRAA